jgi:hypothetical protein
MGVVPFCAQAAQRGARKRQQRARRTHAVSVTQAAPAGCAARAARRRGPRPCLRPPRAAGAGSQRGRCWQRGTATSADVAARCRQCERGRSKSTVSTLQRAHSCACAARLLLRAAPARSPRELLTAPALRARACALHRRARGRNDTRTCARAARSACSQQRGSCTHSGTARAVCTRSSVRRSGRRGRDAAALRCAAAPRAVRVPWRGACVALRDAQAGAHPAADVHGTSVHLRCTDVFSRTSGAGVQARGWEGGGVSSVLNVLHSASRTR